MSAGGSLASGSAVNLAGTGATFNLSGASAQILGTLSGIDGTSVTLGTNALTLNGSTNGTFGGVIGGTGGVTFAGTGTQTLTVRTPIRAARPSTAAARWRWGRAAASRRAAQ